MTDAYLPQADTTPQKFLATLRVTFDADGDLDARLIANECAEAISDHVLEDEDTVDVTQIIPWGTQGLVSPEELVAQMQRTRNLLIKTRIVQCYDMARELDKMAWVLEHRQESSFDISGYDYSAFQDLTNQLLNRTPR